MSSFTRSFYHSGNASLGIVRASRSVDVKSDDINTDIHDYLKSDMGDQRYRELKKSESLRLQNIYIRSTALQGEAEKKGIVNHDSMVVELIVQEEVYHIHAEKVGRRDRGEQVPSGIVIKWMQHFHFNSDQDVKYQCFGSPIGLKEVLEVLKTPPPRYDLIEANCWQYAATATRDLIKKLMDKVEDDDDVRRGKMQRVLDAAQKHLEHSMTVVPRWIGVGITIAAIAVGTFAAAVGIAAMLVSRPDPPPQNKNRT